MDPVLFMCFFAAFIVTFLLTPKWIRKARDMGFVGKDMNKKDKPLVPEAGGVTVIVGTVIGILMYIFLTRFYFSSGDALIEIFAVITTILLAGFIGFIDDILGWKVGMKQRTKILSTIPIAIPLAVVNAGHSTMIFPIIGLVDFGMLFPLILVPIGIIGATNGYNMLAGYNGIETGMGIIMLFTLGLISWLSGYGWVSMLSVIMMSALLAFLWYNRVPARVFPGDSLTYSIGAAIACIAILGNMERVAIILFIPYFFDALMFIRFRFIDKAENVEAFGKVNADGSLELPHKKIYDFTHLAIKILKVFKKRVYEKDVVLFVLAVEILLAVSAFWLWLIEI